MDHIPTGSSVPQLQHGARVIWPRAGATQEQGCPRNQESQGLGPALPLTQRDLGQVMAPLCASISSPVRWAPLSPPAPHPSSQSHRENSTTQWMGRSLQTVRGRLLDCQGWGTAAVFPAPAKIPEPQPVPSCVCAARRWPRGMDGQLRGGLAGGDTHAGSAGGCAHPAGVSHVGSGAAGQ